MKQIYYQFVNFIQEMPQLWFVTIWLVLLAICFVCIMRFYKIYNGTQKTFEKVSLLIIAILIFALLVYLTYIRK